MCHFGYGCPFFFFFLFTIVVNPCSWPLPRDTATACSDLMVSIPIITIVRRLMVCDGLWICDSLSSPKLCHFWIVRYTLPSVSIRCTGLCLYAAHLFSVFFCSGSKELSWISLYNFELLEASSCISRAPIIQSSCLQIPCR